MSIGHQLQLNLDIYLLMPIFQICIYSLSNSIVCCLHHIDNLLCKYIFTGYVLSVESKREQHNNGKDFSSYFYATVSVGWRGGGGGVYCFNLVRLCAFNKFHILKHFSFRHAIWCVSLFYELNIISLLFFMWV